MDFSEMSFDKLSFIYIDVSFLFYLAINHSQSIYYTLQINGFSILEKRYIDVSILFFCIVTADSTF